MNIAGNENEMAVANQYVSSCYKGKTFFAGTIIYPKNGGAVLTNKRRILVKNSVIDLNTGGCRPYYLPTVSFVRIFLEVVDFGKLYKGTAVPTVNANMVKRLLFPVPPFEEQTRIVAKIDELMPLVEEYGKLEDEREQLDSELPDRLRKSILQQAVQGKLVSQDPSDEPASVLLERIREERHKLIKEGKIKAPKGGESVIYRTSDGGYYEKRIDAKGHASEPVCIDDEIPFEIPESWEWARLKTVASLNSGLGYKKDSLAISEEHMIRVLRGGNISKINEIVLLDDDVMIGQSFVDETLLLNPGQIITPAVTSLENVGKAALVRKAMPDTVCGGFVFFLATYLTSSPLSEFLWVYLTSPSHIDFCRSNVKKSGQAFYNLSKTSLNTALIPLPPLEEQSHIVAKLDELMPLLTSQQ